MKGGFQKAEEEHKRNVRLWQQRQDKAKDSEGAGAGAGTTSAEGTPAPESSMSSVDGAAWSLPFGDVSSEENGSQDADELDRESWPMLNTAFIHPFSRNRRPEFNDSWFCRVAV